MTNPLAHPFVAKPSSSVAQPQMQADIKTKNQVQTAQQMANVIRALAMDAVQLANSGHPGAPMGMADMAVALWRDHLQHNPSNPHWLNRDRFVLSNGHASMLSYAVLHLTGYDLPMSELKNFRKLHSKTAGHPEVGVTPGIETTTGPLGQGITNAVGMALAEKLLANEFNRVDLPIVSHNTYVFMGDGCLMEGISHEAIALAGAWKLNKLIALYDDNGISIDGQVTPWFIDNTPQRFIACGWNVITPIDGHDAQAVSNAILQAKSSEKPTLIVCKTHIGKGSPNRANTAKAHGEPLGDVEIQLTRANLNWEYEPFNIPASIYAAWNAKNKGHEREQSWDALFATYQKQYPDLAVELLRRNRKDLPADFAQTAQLALTQAATQAQTMASRKASQLALELFTAGLPELLGGSADLTGSNLTNTSSTPQLRFDETGNVITKNGMQGRHINYGVREFGMAAIMNGVALHGGYIPYGGTFLTFSDYSRNAIRMAALMKLQVIHVFTHDSIGLGEDGPTHQSIEHAASLRLIPNLDVWRPADTLETAVAWQVALQNKQKPTALLLSRQNIEYIPKNDALSGVQGDIQKGAYVLSAAVNNKPQAILMGTGSEVQLAMAAQLHLATQGVSVTVVSMPSTTTFDAQDGTYKNQILPMNVPKIAIEMGVSDGWYKYGCADVVGIDTYGESAPAAVLFEHFGFTVANVSAKVKNVLSLV